MYQLLQLDNSINPIIIVKLQDPYVVRLGVKIFILPLVQRRTISQLL
jgi:hypothetical protein